MTAATLATIGRVAEGGRASREELAELLAAEGAEERELFDAADRVRAVTAGDEVHLRGLIEFSNHCVRDCLYCGLRRGRPDFPRYRMRPEEIVRTSLRASDLGYRTVVLQSGEGGFSAPFLAEAVREIKASRDLAVTLSIGQRTREEYRLLREAGADRFLLRMETSSPELYKQLHPDSDWHERLECLHVLRELGFQLGSGVMIGLPGQTLEMLANDLLFLQELELDMIGVGPFIPHPATPLADASGGTLGLSLRFLSCMRLLSPRALIPATTSLGALDARGWERGLRCGADVLMPNITPLTCRERYDLYPGKAWSRAEPSQFRNEVDLLLARAGRRAGVGHGHSRLRREQAARRMKELRRAGWGPGRWVLG